MFESKFSAVSKGCTCVNKVKQLHYTRNVAPYVLEVKNKTKHAHSFGLPHVKKCEILTTDYQSTKVNKEESASKQACKICYFHFIFSFSLCDSVHFNPINTCSKTP